MASLYFKESVVLNDKGQYLLASTFVRVHYRKTLLTLQYLSPQRKTRNIDGYNITATR